MRPAPASDVRWTWIFGTILILVVVVVIGFLLGITSALSSIDEALNTTDKTLIEVGGEAKPLPDYVAKINSNLTSIDKSLKPIPGQATSILNSLTSIDNSASRINSALGNTSSSLVSTSGSLVDTSGTLQTISGSLTDTSGSLIDTSNSLRGTTVVLGTGGILGRLRQISSTLAGGVLVRARAINRALRSAHGSVGPKDGLIQIPPQADSINASLGGSESDARAINTGLNEVNKHLTSICNSDLVRILPPPLC